MTSLKPLQRVFSVGQTGVDHAALDACLAFGIDCGGWCPKGRHAEDDLIPSTYPMMETLSEHYAERTRRNIHDSDATLIPTKGPLNDGTALTADHAAAIGRPCMVVDLDWQFDRDGVRRWLVKNNIATFNIAGPRESDCLGIYGEARVTLGSLLAVADELLNSP